MAGLFSQDEIERVRVANDIVEVISDYVPLKRMGRSYKALCPFHKEKTASFNVSPAKQIFKCFGCGKGGNVFSFVMALEHVEFPEAVEMLAKRAGMTLTRVAAVPGAAQQADRKEELYEVNIWAARAFHRYLLDEQRGVVARKYLEGRGFDAEAQKRFRLGYAPDNWEFLLGLSASKYRPDVLVRAGLVLQREGRDGFYDRFRSRVMFPIFDVRNRVVGFGGRSLGEELPKYLNSPETPLFDKSRCLYGLNWAKTSIAERKEVLVVEGYTDCLTLMGHGVDWVVATLGTALTEDHVRQLKRYADKAVLLFDGDDAGTAAAERALNVFLAREMELGVVLLPSGMDPADFVRERGRDELLELMGSAQDAFALKMTLIARRHDLSTTQGKAAAVDEVLAVVAQAGSAVRRDILLSDNPLLKDLSGQLGVSESALRDRLAGLMRRRGPSESVGETSRTGAREKAERDILGVSLNRAALARDVFDVMKPEEFSQDGLRDVAKGICEVLDEKKDFELSDVLDRLHSDELIQLGVDLSENVGERGDAKILLDAALKTLQDDRFRLEGNRLKTALAEARRAGDETREIELLGEYQEHLKRRSG